MVTQKKVSKTTKKKTLKTKSSISKKTIKKPVKKKTVARKKSDTKSKKTITKNKVVKKNDKKKRKVTRTVKKTTRKKIPVKIMDSNDISFDNNSIETNDAIENFSSKLETMKKNIDDKYSATKNSSHNKIEKKYRNENEHEEMNKTFFKFRSFNLYRKIALSFILLTVILLAFVFYFSFSSVLITLTPKIEHISDNLILDVYNNKKESDSQYAIKGIVKKTSVELEKVYKGTGSKTISEDIVGEVTIINNYDKNQPLVKSTRLLSPTGIIYHINKTVNVPAGGSVKVGIYTDNPSMEKQTNPTEFTIPGLWAGLQDKIYAKNEEPIMYKAKTETYVQQSDINNAIKDMKTELIKEAERKFSSSNPKNTIVYKIENDSVLINSAIKAGDKVNTFKLKGSIMVEVVAFSNNKVKDLAEKKLLLSIPSNKTLSRFNEKSMKYSLNNFDEQGETASIKVSFSGNIKYKSGANIIDKNKIAGLTKTQLEAYLQGLGSFSDFKIKFYPSFIKKVPTLVDKIKINIK